MMTAFPVDKFGKTIPLLAVVYGDSVDTALTTTSTAAVAINASGKATVVRLWALGCDAYYRLGASDVAAATAADALILTDRYMDVPILAGQTHFRTRAKTGTGFLRYELLG